MGCEADCVCGGDRCFETVGPARDPARAAEVAAISGTRLATSKPSGQATSHQPSLSLRIFVIHGLEKMSRPRCPPRPERPELTRPTRLIVSLSSLPPELLLDIVLLTLPDSPINYDTLPTRISWLHSLLLTCPALSRAARVHLYAHLLVPSPKQARLLLRTLESVGWRGGRVAGHPGRAVRSVRLGEPWGERLMEDGSWVEGVLERVAGEGVREVGVAGVAVDHNVLGRMQRELPGLAIFRLYTIS